MTASKPHNFGLLLVLDLDRGSFELNRVDFHDGGAGLNGIHRDLWYRSVLETRGLESCVVGAKDRCGSDLYMALQPGKSCTPKQANLG
jgi:hypothetical protein